MNFDLSHFFEAEAQEHLTVAGATFCDLKEPFSQWVNVSIETFKQGKKLLFFGNGGSAADAQHLAAEFVVRFKKNRRALPAIALTTDTSTLTAIGNDLGYEDLFARQVEAFAHSGDLIIGISTSGNSPNVLKAMAYAKSEGLMTVGLTGGNGGKLVEYSDILIQIPSHTVSRIQEMHITLGHMLCGAVEEGLGLVETCL